MAYTVKMLSQLSGVTIRTLHFYEELGLLKPSYYGSNGYRYYEEKELLQLQQVLFFKELGFSLKQIQKVLRKGDFDQLAALYSHKESINLEIQKLGQLVKTIEKTIQHLKGKKKMKDREFFNGFSLVKPSKGDESYFGAEQVVLSNLKKVNPEYQTALHRQEINMTANEIYGKVTDCLEKGLEPRAREVQRLIKEHHALTEQFHDASKRVYKALAQLYLEHPAFRKQLDPIHPRLAPFLAEAMTIFADQKL